MDSNKLNITTAELEAMLDRAAKRGAKEALESLGLSDPNAARDLSEMRDLISAWRTTRKEVWRTVIRMVTTGTLIFVGVAVWMNFKTRL